MKIICIGRNYINHTKEFGNEQPKELVVFMKPDTALLRNNEAFYIPSFTKQVDYECELVVRINKIGKNIEQKFAARYYNEIGLGIDFTARDLQKKLISDGLPWEKAKAFDKSAVISQFFISTEEFKDINNIDFKLERNNQIVQNGNSNDMIFSINEIVSEVSKYYTLKIGDLIYTGTPSGVSAVSIGDNLKGYLKDKLMFDFDIK